MGLDRAAATEHCGTSKQAGEQESARRFGNRSQIDLAGIRDIDEPAVLPSGKRAQDQAVVGQHTGVGEQGPSLLGVGKNVGRYPSDVEGPIQSQIAINGNQVVDSTADRLVVFVQFIIQDRTRPEEQVASDRQRACGDSRGQCATRTHVDIADDSTRATQQGAGGDREATAGRQGVVDNQGTSVNGGRTVHGQCRIQLQTAGAGLLEIASDDDAAIAGYGGERGDVAAINGEGSSSSHIDIATSRKRTSRSAVTELQTSAVDVHRAGEPVIGSQGEHIGVILVELAGPVDRVANGHVIGTVEGQRSVVGHVAGAERTGGRPVADLNRSCRNVGRAVAVVASENRRAASQIGNCSGPGDHVGNREGVCAIDSKDAAVVDRRGGGAEVARCSAIANLQSATGNGDRPAKRIVSRKHHRPSAGFGDAIAGSCLTNCHIDIELPTARYIELTIGSTKFESHACRATVVVGLNRRISGGTVSDHDHPACRTTGNLASGRVNGRSIELQNTRGGNGAISDRVGD